MQPSRSFVLRILEKDKKLKTAIAARLFSYLNSIIQPVVKKNKFEKAQPPKSILNKKRLFTQGGGSLPLAPAASRVFHYPLYRGPGYIAKSSATVNFMW